LVANLRRLGDPVEQDHYVKLLASKTGTSEEAVKVKLAQDGEANLTEPQSGRTSGALGGQEPARRAVVQTQGKPTVRVLHEESFLAINLCHPFCRASLGDLVPARFSAEERRAVFELLVAAGDARGEEIAVRSGGMESYVKKLLLVGEEEFGEGEKPVLQQEAFTLARKVFLESNREFKAKLIAAIRMAEQQGDHKQRDELLRKYQAVIDSEAAPQL
jgi:DNA primase